MWGRLGPAATPQPPPFPSGAVCPGHGVGSQHPQVPSPTQAAPIRILRRSPPGVPVQVYVPENGEIITQV